eukprot:206674-Lingulodinium_polyedra.AAC.1
MRFAALAAAAVGLWVTLATGSACNGQREPAVLGLEFGGLVRAKYLDSDIGKPAAPSGLTVGELT